MREICGVKFGKYLDPYTWQKRSTAESNHMWPIEMRHYE